LTRSGKNSQIVIANNTILFYVADNKFDRVRNKVGEEPQLFVLHVMFRTTCLW